MPDNLRSRYFIVAFPFDPKQDDENLRCFASADNLPEQALEDLDWSDEDAAEVHSLVSIMVRLKNPLDDEAIVQTVAGVMPFDPPEPALQTAEAIVEASTLAVVNRLESAAMLTAGFIAKTADHHRYVFNADVGEPLYDLLLALKLSTVYPILEIGGRD